MSAKTKQPRSNDYIVIAAKIPKEDYDIFYKYCQRQGKSINKFIKDIVHTACTQLV